MKERITEIHCSALARPMTCAGSLFFKLPRQPTNAAAEEGTAAGEYLEHLLVGATNVERTHAKNGVEFSSEMKSYITPVAESILNHAEGAKITCETSINWKTRSGIEIKGKYDVAYAIGDTLFISDLKYGWGLVEVKSNWQLLAYAIGEVLRRGEHFETIVLTIEQPRPHHEDGPVRTWEITYDELLGFKEQIEARMDKIASGFSELVTSTHCKYCPASGAACTAFNRAVFSCVDVVLDQAMQDDITDQELADQLDLMARVSDVLKIKTESIKALAVDRIGKNKLIPGYACEQTWGDRKWKSDVTPEIIEMMTGISIVERVMLSPAKSEKLGIPKDLVKMCVERASAGSKLVKKSAADIGAKIFGSAAPELKINKEN